MFSNIEKAAILNEVGCTAFRAVPTSELANKLGFREEALRALNGTTLGPCHVELWPAKNGLPERLAFDGGGDLTGWVHDVPRTHSPIDSSKSEPTAAQVAAMDELDAIKGRMAAHRAKELQKKAELH